jgi:hypothetical protein
MSLSRTLCILTLIAWTGLAVAQKGTAQASDQDRIRGQIAKVEPNAIVVQTGQGKAIRFDLAETLAVFALRKASFAEVDFGTYVGAVSEKLGEDIYSPIVRDSLSWLHRGFELRIIDEKLRGIAVGHTRWDLTKESVMTHGWVDDMEGRVISIKYGPTEEEETDVEVARDTPVLKMSLGDKGLIRPGARVMVGAQKGDNGKPVAVFVFVGEDGVVPPL